MRLLFPVLVGLSLLGLAGCVSAAQGARVSNLSLPELSEPAELTLKPSIADALVTLRYPAYIDPEARLLKNFCSGYIRWDFKRFS